MYCSTCGARVPDGRSNCQACGAVVARMSAPAPAPPTFQASLSFPGASAAPGHAMAGTVLEPVGVCPRCGFRGQSVGYFSRGGHVAGLVTLTIFTAGAMGFGGVLYYLLRREHRVCPRCGEGWGKHGAYALIPGPNGTLAPRMPAQQVDPLTSGSGGGVKTVFSVLFYLFAAFMILVGLGEAELGMVLVGMMSGGGGLLLHRQSRIDRERRKEALLQGLQLPVLQLAGKRGGRLTVTDVATEFGWPMQRAEKVLNSLEDGMRVMSDITDEGVIVYDFLEIRAAQLPPSARPDRPRTLPNGDGGPQQSAIA
ncbi:MAG TPA: hypothetical protein VFR81_23725 [Longimicrobium sp.]|nr:hypothetical protein [Longimicrobium sp.]